MANHNSKHDPKSLEARALEILTERHEEENLTIVSSAQDVVPSSRTKLFKFQATKRDDPNGPHYTMVLDETGAEVNLESLSEREGVEFFAAPKFAVDTAAIGPIATPAASITIDPTVNDLVLNAGDTFTESITVTVPASVGVSKVDVYFLADTTASMEPNLAAVQSGADSILTALAGLGFDMAFGVGNYKDFPTSSAPYAFQHQLSPTTTASAVTAAIGTWSASGGNDGSEGQFFALDQLAEPPGGTIGWRSGAKRILVWFGDAPGHDPICSAISGLPSDITEASVTNKLVAENITALAISTITGFPQGLDDDPTSSAFDYSGICTIGGTAGQATRIATATGGVHQTGIDPTNLVTTIINLVTAATAIKNLSLVPTGATAPFVTSISPAGGYGPLSGDKDHVLKFDVIFTGVMPCTDTAQVFTGTLDAVADGIVVAQKRVKITVPPCKHSYSVKFVCGIQQECPCDTPVVRPGAYATEINIHNFKNTEAQIEKYVLPVVFVGAPVGREPRVVEPRAKDSIVLPPNTATMDDCYRIGELLFGAPVPSPMPLTIGFLEIVSSQELNVTVVYTASDLKSNSISIDVEQVVGKLK
jgi:hypothetical protein